MSEETMTLSDDQLEQIGRYVQKNLPEWLRTLPPQTVQITDPALIERAVRVEEELKAQRELMIERFDAGDKRFESIDKHFEEQLAHSNARFAAVDKRFESIDKRFEEQLTHSNARFEAVDRRFEAVDKRFESIDKRFEEQLANSNARFDAVQKRFNQTQWLLGILVTMFMGLTTTILLTL